MKDIMLLALAIVAGCDCGSSHQAEMGCPDADIPAVPDSGHTDSGEVPDSDIASDAGSDAGDRVAHFCAAMPPNVPSDPSRCMQLLTFTADAPRLGERAGLLGAVRIYPTCPSGDVSEIMVADRVDDLQAPGFPDDASAPFTLADLYERLWFEDCEGRPVGEPVLMDSHVTGTLYSVVPAAPVGVPGSGMTLLIYGDIRQEREVTQPLYRFFTEPGTVDISVRVADDYTFGILQFRVVPY